MLRGRRGRSSGRRRDARRARCRRRPAAAAGRRRSASASRVERRRRRGAARSTSRAAAACAEDERLNRVEPRRSSPRGVHVLRRLAVLAQSADAAGDLGVTGHERPGIPGSAEVLAGVEAEGRGDARAPGAHPSRVAPCAWHASSTIAMPARRRRRRKRAHVGQLAVEVHRHQRVRARADGRRGAAGSMQ